MTVKNRRILATLHSKRSPIRMCGRWAVVEPAFNPSTGKAKEGGSL